MDLNALVIIIAGIARGQAIFIKQAKLIFKMTFKALNISLN